ncbi:MAG TPA: DUF881 domain-containing protein [Arachnia sp.]|nr:DUF881 domain-containing protein [Arachnia sp.]HMT86975.1 DUF881 domain-containing protein [Arachnia sp.]
MAGMVERIRARSGRGSVQDRQRSARGRIATVTVCVVAGVMITVSASAARGYDLRGDRASDLRALAASQHQRTAELRLQAEELRDEVEELGGQEPVSADVQNQLEEAAQAASVLPMEGPAVRVTLNDAPVDVKPAGVDDDALVVHQQDIQAVVNALWAGGAEAMSIQGQRVIATTGIKCVGNTIVLHGVPYAPPYVIVAIGSHDAMEHALDASQALQTYRQYVAAYGLGYSQERLDNVQVPAFAGPLGVSHAQVLG